MESTTNDRHCFLTTTDEIANFLGISASDIQSAETSTADYASGLTDDMPAASVPDSTSTSSLSILAPLSAPSFEDGSFEMTNTVQASILSSFDFVVDVFTLPMGALETSAAALPGLVNAPYGSARLERAEIAVAFAANMLSGCTRRSSERCGDLQHLLENAYPTINMP